jgi:RNA polymerase sigma factor (sigma-70 family)
LSGFAVSGCYDVDAMKSDSELLRDYLRKHSEEAFGELVSRYTDLAYSAALRETNGDAHLAKDATQAVFVSLARKAGTLQRHTSIVGWIYKSVRYEARNIGRANRRRQDREQEAHTMNQLLQKSHEEVDWGQLVPVLDDGMHSLTESDRHAILLRFFERRKFAEVARALGLGEDAARKRVERAIQRLRAFVSKAGIPLSAAGLAEALEANAVTAAPTGIAASISGAALAVAPDASVGPAIFKAIMLSKTKMAIGICLLAISGGWVRQMRQAGKLREENSALRAQLTELQTAAEKPRKTETNAPPIDPTEHRELLRLRGEVGLLKKELATARGNISTPKASEVPWQDRPENQEGIRKMTHAKAITFGLFTYAREHSEAFPTNFDQASEFLNLALKKHESEGGEPIPDGFHGVTNRFELVYSGTLDQVTNWAGTIVLREKEAWQSQDGTWNRTYGFVDGHSEIHRAENGDFDAWEKAHTQQTAAPSASAK